MKFDSDTLPPILNALTTDNRGNKLILEVAVKALYQFDLFCTEIDMQLFSNIWVKMLFDALPWTVMIQSNCQCRPLLNLGIAQVLRVSYVDQQQQILDRLL